MRARQIYASRSRFALTAGLCAAAFAGLVSGCGSSFKSSNSHSTDRQLLKVTLTDQGCAPRKLAAKSGPITFVVVNGGTKKVSELEVRKTNGVILGERENVVNKNDSGTFALKLGPGHYASHLPR